MQVFIAVINGEKFAFPKGIKSKYGDFSDEGFG